MASLVRDFHQDPRTPDHRSPASWLLHSLPPTGDNASIPSGPLPLPQHLWGELFALLSAAAWAVGVILYRKLGAQLAPLTLNFLKNALVLAMLVPAIVFFHGLDVPDFTAWEVALALASGVIGIGIADTLYFRALNELGAGRMGILGNAYSPFVLLLGFVFLGERLGGMQWIGFALVTAGVLLASWPRRGGVAALPLPGAPATDGVAADASSAHPWRGLLIGLSSVLLMAIAIVLAKRVLEAQPLLWVTGVRMLGALGGMVAIALVRGEMARLRPPPGLRWWPLVRAAFVGQFLAMLLWLAGYKYTLASIAAVLNETASIFILVLAAWWLKEPLTRRGLAGVMLTLTGVCCMLWTR
jgi:drug/metabolite transporter (DMT)-like permease